MARANITFSPGLVLDDTPFKVGQAGWTACDKVRFHRNLPQVIGGWEAVTAEPLDGVCRGLHTWRDNDGALNHALGTTEELYVIVGGDPFTITPSGLSDGLVDSTGGQGYGTGTYSTGLYSRPSTADYTARTWSFASYGETLLACPSGETIYQWSNNTASAAAAVTNAPASVQCILVPMEKRHVVAYGCTDISGNYNPRAIRWSDFEDLTDWTPSASNNAGQKVLEGSGRIVKAMSTTGGEFVWTTSELWYQTYLGDPTQTYQFTRLGTGCGLIGPNAAVTFEGGAFWMSPDGGFWACSAGGTPTRITSPVEQDVRDNLASVQDAKVYAATVGTFREVWWFYPDARDGNENSRYVSLQLDSGAWAGGELARTAFLDAGTGPSPIAVDPDGNVFYHERGRSANGGAIDWSLESGGFYAQASERFIMYRSLYPDVEEQQGLAKFELITKEYPQGDETTHGPYDLMVGQDRVDFRASGRISRVKFYGSAAPCFFRLGQINMDITPRGRR